jgi:hypothetical protein
VVAIASLLAACTSDGSSSTGRNETTPLGDPDAPRYETTATVIGTDHGAQVCGAVLESLPPQCGGGTPIDGWDWESVPHESSGPVRWGTYELVVTYDRARSRYAVAGPVAEPVPDVDAPPDPDYLLNVNCPEPDGGWQWADVTEAEQEAFLEHAASLDGFAGSWMITIGFGREPGQRQISVAYLDQVDVEARRAELQAIWPAPICVVERTHSLDELQSIEQELLGAEGRDFSDLARRYGAVGYTNVADHEGVIRLSVLIAEPGAQEELDARFGAGAVELVPVLRPVD